MPKGVEVRLLLAELGNPHLAVPAIHVAGSKGKGSTAAMIASALRAAGHRVGFFSSPHLHDFRERIRIDGEPVSPAEIASLADRVRPAVERVLAVQRDRLPTPHEISAAMAFLCFAERGATYQVIEAFLGGLHDATNVIVPLVSVITSISFEHMAILGTSLEAIAAQKAGIIKPGGVAVVAPQQMAARRVFEQTAAACGARLIQVGKEVLIGDDAEPVPMPVDQLNAGQIRLRPQVFPVVGRFGRYDLSLPLLGRHQQENAATAIAALECLMESGVRLNRDDIVRGLAAVEWPGRLEIIATNPLVVVDGAHNADSAWRLVEALRRHFQFQRLIIVVGTQADKDADGMASAFATSGGLLLATRSSHPRARGRALDPAVMAAAAERAGLAAEVIESVTAALDRARRIAGPSDIICVTGSIPVVAETIRACGQAGLATV